MERAFSRFVAESRLYLACTHRVSDVSIPERLAAYRQISAAKGHMGGPSPA